MKSNVILLPSIILLLVASSCQKENLETETSVEFANVDPALWSFYKSFEVEASRRGFDYDLNALKISGKIQEIHQDNVAGSCKFGSQINNEVTIDLGFWNKSSEIYKEFVIFHELGHCVLLRDHDESVDGQGRCLSIMRSGLTNCQDTYSAQNREIFIDELFFQN